MNQSAASRFASVFILIASAAAGGSAPQALPLPTHPVGSSVDRFTPTIPKVWDDAFIVSLELPLVEPAHSPKHVTADYYYKIPVCPIYRSYPVYHPDREPTGYLESLLKREQEIVWNDSDHRPELQTESDWLQAGEIVFDAPTRYDQRVITSAEEKVFVRDPE